MASHFITKRFRAAEGGRVREVDVTLVR